MLAKIVNIVSIKGNNVDIKKDYQIRGFIYFDCHATARVTIGDGFVANSAFLYNNIGRQQRTAIIAKKGAMITIGDNVGISSSTLVAQKKISIGNNVRFGGNTVVYDSDFHSLDARERISKPEIKTNIRSREVVIEDNVFIGSHVTILKGSHIGENSIVAACAVVSGYIPPNEIWGGNPAKFIKRIKGSVDYAQVHLLNA